MIELRIRLDYHWIPGSRSGPPEGDECDGIDSVIPDRHRDHAHAFSRGGVKPFRSTAECVTCSATVH